jgi:hypothetical protein
MSTRRGWPGLLLAGQTIAAGTAIAQAPPIPVAAQPGDVTLEVVDRDISNLRQLPWRMTEAPGKPTEADEAGRRVEDDIADYILTEPALAAIARMRDELAAGTAPGAVIPAARLLPLQRQMAVEFCRFTVVAAYWTTRKARTYHHDLIEALIGRLAQPQQPEASRALQAIDALPGAPRTQIAPSLKSCDEIRESQVSTFMDRPDADRDLERLAKEYNALRIKLAAQLDAARAGQAEHWTKRSTPCPAPGTGSSGKRLQIRSRPDVRDYYPVEALPYRVAGEARIRLAYDTTGCVVMARVLSSTGSDVLDAAGLKFTFAIELTPGEEDGKPMAGMAVQPINFQVYDVDASLFRPPGPAAQPQP